MNPLDVYSVINSNNTAGTLTAGSAVDLERMRTQYAKQRQLAEIQMRMSRLAEHVDPDLINKFGDDTDALLAQLIREISAFRKCMGVETQK